MLRKEYLLDIIRNFILFDQIEGRQIKIISRYQQFRAVHRAIERLRTGKTRRETVDIDQRGGIVWHTQGSGKSLTMVQKYQERAADAEEEFEIPKPRLLKAAAPSDSPVRPQKPILFPVWNASEKILVLVDEAHRSHSSMLHANLMRALPNCAKIGFTGTPIIAGTVRKKTHEIFGDYIDQYTIEQSQKDGSTVKILYEGRRAEARVEDGRTLDQFFDDMFRSRTEEEREAIRRKYGNVINILEARDLIQAKAEDMLLHYAANIMPNGFKAQVVAVSRRAAIRYYEAFAKAKVKLLKRFQLLDPRIFTLSEDEQKDLDEETRFLIVAKKNEYTLRKLEFAAIISGDHNDPPSYKEHTDPNTHESLIGKNGRFKRSLSKDPLAFIIVKSMLLVGFDAPVKQVMYLDRFMHGHELLQAIARVNGRYPGKTRGLVVDYFGVGDRLTEALAIYSKTDIKGALFNIKDELPKLDDRHRRLLLLFKGQGIVDISDIDACVDELRVFVKETREGREEDQTGLDPKTQAPFLGILLEEYGKKPNDRKMKQFCEAVIDIVDHIRQEIAAVDFWRSRHAQDMLRMWIINEIDDRDLILFQKQDKLADRFLELSKAIHMRLITT